MMMPKHEKKPRSKKRSIIVATGILCSLAVIIIAWPRAVLNTPLPNDLFNVHISDPVVGYLDKEYPVEHADTGGGDKGFESAQYAKPVTKMSIRKMSPGSVFVPELKLYSEIKGSTDMIPSRYAGFDTFYIPPNAHRSSWFSGGAPLTVENVVDWQTVKPEKGEEVLIAPEKSEQQQGVTMLASHINSYETWGAYAHLHEAQPGIVVWTKDFDGNIQAWRAGELKTSMHLDFPEEYFSPEGERKLVMVTCGGSLNSQGYYNQNIFMVSYPVDTKLSIEDAEKKDTFYNKNKKG